jgi:hypothetical protein
MVIFTCSSKLLNTYMRYEMIRKGNNFHTEVELDIARVQVVPKKVRFDTGFLGCVECSTNGDLMGKRRIYVPPSRLD